MKWHWHRRSVVARIAQYTRTDLVLRIDQYIRMSAR